MSFGNRRKRGRPRRGEVPPLNDIDLALIQEFQQRPAFYDRTHPQYRNREFLEPQWLEMAHNLGQNVAVIKNRMIQLRNRYNLEKRRVETLQEQYNDPDITSQWPLYEHLTFLGDHIKSRRSFVKPLLPLHTKQPPPSDSSETDDCDESIPFLHPQTLLNNQQPQPPPPSQQQSRHQPLPTQRSVPTPSKASEYTKNSSMHSSDIPNDIALEQTLDVSVNAGNDKFRAFGQFLASSLIEMNEKDALRLVEKFTSELVKSLLSEQGAKALPQNDNSNTLVNVNHHQYVSVPPVANIARIN